MPLGGPPFRDLISTRTLSQLGGWEDYTSIKAPDDHDARLLAATIFHLYTRGTGTKKNTLKLWEDAEQFIDCLDIAAREPLGFAGADVSLVLDQMYADKRFAELRQAIKHGFLHLGELHREAVRFIAGACSTFLLRAEDATVADESEHWAPYRRWYDRLVPGADSVITFNYDRVLDVLTEYGRRKRPARDIFMSPAGQSADSLDAHAEHVVPVYHLHGHVGWLRSKDGKTIDVPVDPSNGTRRNLPVAHKEPERAVIGVPGQHKLTLPATLLKDMWRRAAFALEGATAVVFVGYRFPPTDNMPKSWLLDALRKNPKAPVHVVLGANNPDMPRLKGMIEWTREKSSNPVRVHEMWSQDFFAVFRRDLLSAR